MKVDMIVIRHSSPGAPHFLSRHIKANIINAGDGTHEHPTQALLDAVRSRSGLPSIPVSLEAIWQERRLELAGEGHR